LKLIFSSLPEERIFFNVLFSYVCLQSITGLKIKNTRNDGKLSACFTAPSLV
jgi:hypothetical protein